ncbi:MAG: FkbM family methyltransferase [Paracoccaceae bacterium]
MAAQNLLMESPTATVAQCFGVDVPMSPYLNPGRVARINAGLYERSEILGALALINKDDRVLEMGAGLGIVGAAIAQNAQPQAILSFEANPALIPHIQELYQLNGISWRIQVKNQILLASQPSGHRVPIFVGSSFLGSSLLASGSRRRKPVWVPTAAYEIVRQTFKPSILVMDVEGAELDFLTHANLDSIRGLVIEFHPKAYGVGGMKRCKSILRAAGFNKRVSESTRTVWVCERAP